MYGLGVRGLGFRVLALGFRALGLVFVVHDLGVWVLMFEREIAS